MPGERNWDRELARIDKQLEKLSDAELLDRSAPSTEGPRAGAGVETRPAPLAPAGPAAPARHAAGSRWGMYARLLLSLSVAGAMLFWPYDARCGLGLAGYLFAASAVAASGVWSAVFSWRARSAGAHLASIAVVAWGMGLAAMEILPRAGYAIPTEARPATWSCP